MAMSPLYSWLATAAIGATLAWYYLGRPNLFAKFTRQGVQGVEEAVPEGPRKRKAKPRRSPAGEQIGSGEGTSTPISSAEDASKRKRKADGPAAANWLATSFDKHEESEQSPGQDEDGNLNNKEFAKQFTQARSGTPIASASVKPGLSKKERQTSKNILPAKRKANNDLDKSHPVTDASSTTGADGDDDLSPVGTPPLDTTSSKVTKAGDISDMLEAPVSGPAVLRLTDPKGTMNKVQTKSAAKPFEVAETKKQRQARQKREAAKAASEEAERQRRKLMEKQIRGARMAEGTSAQSKTTAFKPLTENAWFANNDAQATATAMPPSVPYVEELDVREPVTERRTPGNGVGGVQLVADVETRTTQDGSIQQMREVLGIGQTKALGASSRENDVNDVSRMDGVSTARAAEPASSEQSGTTSWADDVMSEEEQMKMLQDQEDSWKTVSGKKDRKKGAKAGESSLSTTSEASVEPLLPLRTNGVVQRPGTNGALKRIESSNRYAAVEQDDDTWEA